MHNLKHNKVLHERVVLLNVRTETTPRVAAANRYEAHTGLRERRFRLFEGLGSLNLKPEIAQLRTVLNRIGD